MARYIKANSLVAKFLNLQNDRLLLKDGNYILWQADMLAFGPLVRLNETLASIGAIALMPHEAKQEQDGIVTRPLPEATDPRFIIPAPAPVETVDQPESPVQPTESPEETTDESEAGTDAEAQTETETDPEPTTDKSNKA